VLRRCLTSFLAAAALSAPIAARAQTPTLTSQADSAGVADDGEEAAPSEGWRAATGLRVEQWIAPTDDHLRFNVRVTLPEVAFGDRLAFSAFAWERLDVAEGKKTRGENGTVYQLLGARYRSDHERYGFFVGAHALTWSGHGRPVTPWLGVRLGPVDGPSITAEARLLGLGPQGGDMTSPLDDTDVSVAIEGPRLGPVQIAARGRARDVRHPDRHQREQMASLGVEFNWGPKRLFLGLGIQHQMRRAAAQDDPTAMPPTAARMATPDIDPSESTAVMLHLDAESPLPRSILPN
jgi:hypothetical protein